MTHIVSNSHTPDCGHQHGHHHEPTAPHPAQMPAWSILRTTLAVRLGGALAISTGLWAIVVLAMR